jgi:hypothetical protein
MMMGAASAGDGSRHSSGGGSKPTRGGVRRQGGLWREGRGLAAMYASMIRVCGAPHSKGVCTHTQRRS